VTEEDVMAVQNAARLLRMIAARRAYTKDCDLGEPDRAATIRDAAAYAQFALERLEPALDRMVRALTDEQRKPANVVAERPASGGSVRAPS
jgi:hypothetical protein